MWNDAADEWPVGVLQLPALSVRSMALGGRREEEREEGAAEAGGGWEEAAPPAASCFFFSFSASVAWKRRRGGSCMRINLDQRCAEWNCGFDNCDDKDARMEHKHAFTAGTKQTFILAIRLRSSSLNSALDMEADIGKRQNAVVLPRKWLFKFRSTGSS